MGQSIRGSTPRFDFTGHLLDTFASPESLAPTEMLCKIFFQDLQGKSCDARLLITPSGWSPELIKIEDDSMLFFGGLSESGGEGLFSAYSGLKALLGTYLDNDEPFFPPLFPKLF